MERKKEEKEGVPKAKNFKLKTLIAEHSGSNRQKKKLAERGHVQDNFQVDLQRCRWRD